MKVTATSNQYNKKLNFGWMIKTHGHMTELALREFEDLQPYKKLLIFGSKAADLSPLQNGWFNRSHEFHGKIPTDNKTKNSLGMFNQYSDLALMHIMGGNTKYAMYRAGNALHYLQDVNCALHTLRPAGNPILERLTHLAYELKAGSYKTTFEGLYGQLTQTPIKDMGMADNFMDSYHNSLKQGDVFLRNKDEWDIPLFESYCDAIESSKVFLKRLSKFLQAQQKNHRENILESISNDAALVSKES